MVIKKPGDIRSSEITGEKTYLSRRNFLRAGLLAGTTLASGALYRYVNPPPPAESSTAAIPNIIRDSPFSVDEPQTSLRDITNYNNFYEFSTNKESVALYAKDFVTRPWTVEVGGMVLQPRVFGIEDLLKLDQEERIYRHRCVEGWSMVIPWAGFPLKSLLDKVEPLSTAKYVAFQTFYDGVKSDNPEVKLPTDKTQMPNGFFAGIQLPYVEGLRLDEAMHPLTILATGLYGRILPNQNGAPLRLVVPWKYGFKSIKSIVRITLTDFEPPTTWNIAARSEYGFYSNVNPGVPHPRWSQASERRIGEVALRATLPFNGYGEQVAGMYQGMDLKKYF